MSDKPKRVSHEDLLAGRVNTTCILNEPVVDFVIDFVVPTPESAAARARHRWSMDDPESGAD